MLLTISVTFPRISSHLSVSAEPQLPVVSITAPPTVTAPETTTFNVSVWLESSDSIEVFQYEVYMTVNDTILSTENAWTPTGNDSWIFHGKDAIPVSYCKDTDDNGVCDAAGLGGTLLGDDSKSVTGSVLLGIIQLQVRSTGTATLNITGTYQHPTEVLDPDFEEIDIEKKNKQVDIEGYVPTETSEITIEVNPPTAVTEQSVTITGKITPDKPNVDVTITQQLTPQDPWVKIATVKTNQTSHYKLIHSFLEAGPSNYNFTFVLRASWKGDHTHLGNVSEPFEVTVKEPDTIVEIRFADENQQYLGDPDLPLPTPPAIMNVTVNNATDLYEWKIKIYYDPKYVKIDDIWLPTDNVLGLTGHTYTTSVNTSTNYAYCEATINETGNGYTGNGTLFQFDLTGLSATPEPGTTLSMSAESILKDSEGNQIFCRCEDLYFFVEGSISTIIEVINPKTGKNNFTFYSEETSVGDVFNATIEVENATDLYGWLLKLTYNATLLNATRVIKPSGNTTYVFYNKVSEMNYILEDGAVSIDNTLTEGEEPFEESGLLVVIEFEILLAPTNETAELGSSLTVEEQEVFNGLIWQALAKVDGEYVFKYGAQTSEDEEEPSTWLEDYWPYMVGLIVVVIVVYLAFRRLRKGREISPEEKEI